MCTGVEEGSISFLKKRNKKLFDCWMACPVRSTRTEESQSFLVLFSKKELLPWLFLSVCLAASYAQPVVAKDADWGLRPLMAELARVASASARFTERKTMHVLSAPMLASGTLTYIAPSRMEKTTLSPMAERFVLDHEEVSIAGGPGSRTERFSLAKAPQIAGLVAGIRATLAGDLATLETYYVVQVSGTESVWRLNLQPRSAASARFVRRISILGNQDRISEIDTESPNGDHSEMMISETVVDAK
jgi:hypothetical protein